MSRYRVLALLCALSMITYLDRVCFGRAARDIVAALHLPSEADLKLAFTMFAVAYGLFEVPAGWLGDRIGPRATLLRIVAWWSFCTALTGLVGIEVGGLVLGGLGTLVVLRFLFGAGEAGAYPLITRAIHNWFPAREWPLAQSLIWMSGRIMGGLTPLVWALLVTGTAWTPALVKLRGAFVLFGAFGLVWCVVFALTFRDRPDDEPTTTSARTAHAVPWAALLTSRTMWALCVMYACITYGWYFNITYLPAYMQGRYSLPDNSVLGAIYMGGPLWVGAIGWIVGGVLASWLARTTGSVRKARAGLGVVALSLAAGCWFAAGSAPNEHVFFLLVSGAAFFNDLILGAAWATCQDIGGRSAAVVAAWMNTMGTVGAAAAGWVSGWLIDRSLAAAAVAHSVAVEHLPEAVKQTAKLAGYSDNFLVYAAMYVVAAACWLLINPTKPLHGEEPS